MTIRTRIALSVSAVAISLGLALSPALASGAMALSSVCVLGNALRLRWLRPVGGPAVPAAAATAAQEVPA